MIYDPTCITSLCGLCQFDINPDKKIAIYQLEKWVRLVPNASDQWMLCDGQYCNHPKGLGIGCHLQCLSMSALRTPQGLIEATRHTFQSRQEEESRRRSWLKDSLASQLSKSFTASKNNCTRELPIEVCLMVARDLLSLYATGISRGLWSPPQNCKITVDKPVWCGVVSFEGKLYISSLSNFRSEHHTTFLFCPPKTIDRVFIQENHIGIISVYLSDSDVLPDLPPGNVPGIWWRCLFVTQERIVHGESDGIKLRSLRVGDDSSMAWSVPPPNKARFEYFENMVFDPREWHDKDPKPTPNQMVAVSCNDPEAVGYSLLWSGRIMMIHAHKKGEDMSFYITQPHTCWLHMPVDQGELITEIYKGCGQLDHDSALGIKTSKGRCFLAGVCNRRARRWTLIDRPGQEARHIFYEASPTGINALAFENDYHSTPNQEFHSPLPPATSIRMSQQDYFYSSSQLRGLQYITPCRTEDRSSITGLLLSFADGHRESVGQVRLDLLTEHLDVSENQTAILGFRKKEGKHPCPYVAEIASPDFELGNNFVSVMQIFCRGKLEWFWTWFKCYVMYEGQESPRPI